MPAVPKGRSAPLCLTALDANVLLVLFVIQEGASFHKVGFQYACSECYIVASIALRAVLQGSSSAFRKRRGDEDTARCQEV